MDSDISKDHSAGSPGFVSVVIPCYNCVATVGECLSSLSNQTYLSNQIEIIVVDNGSSDGSYEYIATNFPSVRLFHEKKKGSGYARNAGILKAHGKLVLSTDSDCLPDKNWITSMVSAFEQAAPSVAGIAGPIVPYSLRRLIERYDRTWITQPALTNPDPGQIRYCATPNAAFLRSAILEVGLFDGTLGFDDTDLGIRLTSAGYAVGFAAEAVVRHRNPATLFELYSQKFKYGRFNYFLARKHPSILGDPTIQGKQSELFNATIRRVAGNLFVKLPRSLLSNSPGRPRFWPLFDSVIAFANYRGFRNALTMERSASPGHSHSKYAKSAVGIPSQNDTNG